MTAKIEELLDKAIARFGRDDSKELFEAEKAKVAEFTKQLADKVSELEALKAEFDKSAAELTEAKAAVTDFAAKVEEAAAAKAATIVASLGVPEVPTVPAQPADPKDEIRKLKGLAKVIALERFDSESRKKS